MSLAGAHRFCETLTNFLALLRYWASVFGAAVFVEHFVSRRNDFGAYNYKAWNTAGKLPTGLTPLGTCLVALGVVVPTMEQVRWTGANWEEGGRYWVRVSIRRDGVGLPGYEGDKIESA
jgi:purine-cytosine permease-like protein